VRDTVVRPAVFLDRDGVLNEDCPGYVTRQADFRLLPGVLEALALLAQLPVAIVVVTNQSAVGRGQMTRAALDDIHAWLCATVAAAGGRIDAVYVCPHCPWDGCACRKPTPGLLYQAAADWHLDLPRSYFIGDALTDVEAARKAGCRSVLVLTGHGRDALRALDGHDPRPDFVASDVLAAAHEVLRQHARETAP
jgi:D-glycero-D-manno-heptose 1,7-bisphosphate phosphatase